MCGIAGIHRRTSRNMPGLGRLVDGLLLAIDHRGGDATGIASVTDRGVMRIEKDVSRSAQFILTRQPLPASARTVLLHTRMATKGRADDPRNAHPVVAGQVAVIHNGMIYNDDALFAKHGMTRTAAVDSIVIPAIINHLGWDRVSKALGLLDGGAAIAAFDAATPGEMILARTERYPLEVLITEQAIVWASERRAIERAWKWAYGSAPAGGWYSLPDRTMMHVNGTIAEARLSKPQPKRWQPPTYRPSLSLAAPHKPTRRRRRGKKNRPTQLPLARGPQVTDERVADDAVRDLMRWADCTWAEAYEAVHGTTPPEGCDPMPDLHWDDDLLIGWEDD